MLSCNMYVYNCLFRWYISPLFLLYFKTEIPIFFQLSYIFYIKSCLTACKCEDFLIAHLRVDTQKHLLFATEIQLNMLKHASRWFMEGTFKTSKTKVIIIIINANETNYIFPQTIDHDIYKIMYINNTKKIKHIYRVCTKSL